MSAPLADGHRLSLADLGQLVFDTIVAQFAAAGVELPDRKVMVPGAPEQVAWDCEALILTLSGVGPGTSPSRPAPVRSVGSQFGATVLKHAVWTVQLVRCDPKPNSRGGPPTVAALNSAAQALWVDAGLLAHALDQVGSDLTRKLPPGTQVEVNAVSPAGPEGGFVGIQGSVTMTVGNLV